MKKVISYILIMVLSIAAMSGLLLQIPNIPKGETPVATISNDNYIPYNNQQSSYLSTLKKEAEAAGGYLETYASEEEYNKVQALNAAKYQSSVANTSTTFTPVKQTITVMTTTTGSTANGNYVKSEPIANAIVRIDGVPRFTDRNGQITTTISKEVVELYIEKTDDKNGIKYNPHIEYMDVVSDEVNGVKTNIANKIVYLKEPNDNIDIYAVILEYNGEIVNLLTQDYGIDKDDDDIDDAYIEIRANINADSYRILQDDKVILSNNNGKFNHLQLKQLFRTGGNIGVQVTYQGIESKRVNTTLEFVDSYDFDVLRAILKASGGKNSSSSTISAMSAAAESNGSGETNFDIGSDFGEFAIPSILFVFEALTKMNNDRLKITFIHDNKKKEYTIMVGFTLAKKTIKESTMRDMDKGAKGLDTLQSMGGDWVSNFRSYINNSPEFAFQNLANDRLAKVFKGSFKVSLDVLGIIKFSTKDNQFKLIQCNIGLDVRISVRFSWQWVIVVVPVYIYLDFEVLFYLNFEVVDRILGLMVRVTGTVGGGVGIDGVVNVGVALRARVTFEWNFFNGHCHIKGEVRLLFEAQFLMFKYMDVIWDIAGPKIIWKNYDDDETFSTSFQVANLSQYFSDTSNEDIVYEDAKPKIVQVGDKLVSVYLDASIDGDNYNPTRLMYTVCENGSWSEPLPINDNGCADFYPDLYVINGEVCAIWQRFSKRLSQDDNLSSIASTAEIYISQFDKITNTFYEPVRITNNDKWDVLPHLTADEQGNLVAVWISNSENSIFGTTGQNAINYSIYKNSLWSDPQVLYSTSMPILAFDCIWKDNNLLVAANISKSDNLALFEEREVFFISKNGVSNITNNDCYSGSARLVSYENSVLLFFNDNNMISYVDVINISNRIDIMEHFGDFNVFNNDNELTIIYVGVQNEINQIKKSVYDKKLGIWCPDVTITNSDYKISQFSAFINNENKLIILYQQLEKDDYGNILKSKLCFEGDTSLTYDLELTEIFYFDNFKENADNEISVLIRNNGSYAFDSLKFTINGIEYQVKLDEPLLPNHSKYFDLSFYYGSEDQIFICAEIDGYIESDFTNNNYILDTRFISYEMKALKIYSDNKEQLQFDITNLSKYDSLIKIRVLTESGYMVFESNNFTVTANENKLIILQLDYKELGIKEETLLRFEIISDLPQLYNQYDYLLVNGYEDKIIIVNPYYDVLKQAKGL